MAPAQASKMVAQSGLMVGEIHCIAGLQLASKCGENRGRRSETRGACGKFISS
jgi:hypothetical protein